MVFGFLFLIPCLIALICFLCFRDKITVKEFLVQLAASAIVAGVSGAIIYSSNVSDYEIIHGQITDKKQVRVSCRHSYRCNCYTTCSGSGNNRTCTEHCSTCYEHSNDWDWEVYSTIGTFDIDTIDRQGRKEPPRWTAAKIGEHAARQNGYDNYIKGAPDTLFKRQGLVEKYKKEFPAYPGKIYDYYRIDRFITYLNFPNTINEDLREINKEIGKSKQASLAVVIVNNKDKEYFHALEEFWLGGKKNDVILVISADDHGIIQWVDTLAWSKNELFKVKLRDDVLEIGNIQKDKEITSILRKDVVELYERKPMKDFEYLKDSVRPTVTQWVVSMIIGALISIGLTMFMFQNDVFSEEGYNNRRRY